MHLTLVLRQTTLLYVSAVSILTLALIANARLWQTSIAKPHRHSSQELEEYTFLETEFPETLIGPADHPYDSLLTIEDSVHYAANASTEWNTLFPEGSGGFVRLGPAFRLFGVSMFHQLHCLDKMRRAVIEEPPTEWEKWHTQHCLNYVRQMLLCASSTRLEPATFVDEHGRAGLKVDGLGMEHTCRDWSSLRHAVEENYEQWPDDMY